MKKRRGRPKIGTANAKGELFGVRVTPGEAEQINQAIQDSGLSKPDWLRKTLISASGTGSKSS